jgi:1-acyl-sn-glycerol-3-phosphate acyltransferase
MPFKPGVIRLALDTNVAIVPVTIIGGYRAFSPHHKFPRPRKLKIVYHPPVRLTPPTDEAQLKKLHAGASRAPDRKSWPPLCRS